MEEQLRAVRARIRAGQVDSQVTRTRELIASSRIVRAQQRMRARRAVTRARSRQPGGWS